MARQPTGSHTPGSGLIALIQLTFSSASSKARHVSSCLGEATLAVACLTALQLALDANAQLCNCRSISGQQFIIADCEVCTARPDRSISGSVRRHVNSCRTAHSGCWTTQLQSV